MSKTKELDRISTEVYNQVFEYLYETTAKELEYSDLEDINETEFHEYVMDKVIYLLNN